MLSPILERHSRGSISNQTLSQQVGTVQIWTVLNAAKIGGIDVGEIAHIGAGGEIPCVWEESPCRWEGEPVRAQICAGRGSPPSRTPEFAGVWGRVSRPRYPAERRVPRIEAGGRKYPPPMGPQIRNSKGGPNFVPLFALVRLSGSFLGSQQKAGGIQKNIPGLCLPMLKSSR